MDLAAIVERLAIESEETSAGTDKNLDEFVRTSAGQVAERIRKDQLKIVDLIKGMNAILTSTSYHIRSRGVELLAQVVALLPQSLLNEKEIELLTEFICLRLIDHKSMERAALRCLSYFVDCQHKPARYNKQVIEFIKSKANIHKMEPKTRHAVYELLKKFVAERKRQSNKMDGDFIYTLVTILEGENNPDNLMICFGMIAFLLKNFDQLDPYIDDIFEWLSSYYPIDYTPAISDANGAGEMAAINIQRSDLVEALYECFYANELNAENLQTLLLEKLESNVVSSKLESLECLIKCYEKPFPLASIVKYNSTLWTALRMNCLRKMDSVDPKLLETSLRTLSSLAKRLAKDGDLYFTFISDMYEELAIAFRKPEMDLFEAAARLITHAIMPNVVGFNYVLDKMLPISLNALEAGELRPLSGLAYMFEKLSKEHPEAKLKEELGEKITRLALKVANHLTSQDENTLRLLEALICLQVPLDETSLNELVRILWAQLERGDNSKLDLEKCLALICTKYKRFDIIITTTNDEKVIEKCDLNSLLRLIYQFDQAAADAQGKFSVFLRLLMLELDLSKGPQMDALDQLVLNDSLHKMRDITWRSRQNQKIVQRSAMIHAIILNKLEANNVNQVLMSFFSSNYCQNLVASDTQDDNKLAALTFVSWIFKSLVIRNHQLSTPLINLVLNCITSDKVAGELARRAAEVFSFVLGDDELFARERHYQIFSLYKQKFHMQTCKEIRIRFDKQAAAGSSKKSLLVYAVASQLVHLPAAVYKRDYDWLVRELLRVISASNSNATRAESEDDSDVVLVQEIYGCLEKLIQKELCDGLVNFLPSLIDLNLTNAQQAKSMQIRRRALLCLAKIASSFKESDLLVYRTKVVDRLRACLADKKRLVRQAAGETRLRWMLIGQPIGSA